ncbi:MAG: hypothetical protein KJ043_19575 [Anaerolineae bacterium]|nr:hypothetical protein [Anaerolineae bacterium]
MPINVVWDDEEKTIVRQTYGQEISIAEYYDGVKKRLELISSVDHPVDLIIDLRGANTNLKGVLTASRYANKHVPPNQRFVVLVGANLFVKSLVNVLGKILPKISNTIYFVETPEVAKQLIDENRAKWTAQNKS